jgi:hypothetical protein
MNRKERRAAEHKRSGELDAAHGEIPSHRETSSHREIPCTYRTIPDGYWEDAATDRELARAGFRDTTPEREQLLEGEPLMLTPDVAPGILVDPTAAVIRDPEGRIVARWDQDRWWTPEEFRERSL